MKKIIILLIVIVLTLAGCSKSEATTNEGMVPYESVNGEIMIPEDPQRIVTDLYTGELLSLGAPVVGGDLSYPSPAWEGHLDGVTDVGQSVEAVATLEPDLIITYSQEYYEQYSLIAPTVVLPYEEYNEEERLTEIGIITGREAEAEEILKNYDAQVEELSKLIDHPEYTYTTMEIVGNDAYVYGNGWGRFGHTLYDKLDLKATPMAEETILQNPESWLLLTQENIPDYIGDVVLMSTPNGEEVDNALTQSETFKSTSAYKNDHIYYVDAQLFYFTDPLSVKGQMEVFEEIIKDPEI